MKKEQYGIVRADDVTKSVEQIQKKFSINEQAEIVNCLMDNNSLQKHIEFDFKQSNPIYLGFFNWFAQIRHYCFLCGRETRNLESWISHLINEHDFKFKK